ncbi:MAG: hypothetical protein V4538_02415 [Bacteroidota bacterium]
MKTVIEYPQILTDWLNEKTAQIHAIQFNQYDFNPITGQDILTNVSVLFHEAGYYKVRFNFKNILDDYILLETVGLTMFCSNVGEELTMIKFWIHLKIENNQVVILNDYTTKLAKK